MSLAEVTSRISQLEARLGMQPSGVLGNDPGPTGTGFSSALADALGQATGTTDAASGTTGTAPTGADGSPPMTAGQRALALARSYTGVPYLWGGTDPAQGLDCSGLTQLVYGQLGVKLPRVAADQARAGVAVPSLAQAQPGDLVFFGSPAHHVGIVAGGGMMIDAPHTGSSVGLHQISGYGTVSAIRRVAPASTSAAAAGTLALARAQLLSAAGLSSLAALTPSAGLGATNLGATAGATESGLGGPYAALFQAAGARYGVDPALLSAVARTESGYDPTATSAAGAQGLMQLMPGTARSLGVDATDPTQAVDGAARLLSGLLDQFGGRVDLALAGYNAGAGSVRRYGGVPPFSETRTYVQRVTDAWEALR